jgi:hypothetical protein
MALKLGVVLNMKTSKIKLYNPLTNEYTHELFLTDAKMVYRNLLKQIENSIPEYRLPFYYKKMYSDALVSQTYYNLYRNKTAANHLVFDTDFTYAQSNVNLETGHISRFFSCIINDKIYWTKIQNSKVTDLYEWQSTALGDGNTYEWVQWNPETLEPEAYYLNKTYGEINLEEHKFNLPSKELDSVSYFVSDYQSVPEEFKSLIKNFEFVKEENVICWGNKPYGKYITFLESEEFLEDDPLYYVSNEEEIKNKENLHRISIINDIKSRISAIQNNTIDNNSEWVSIDVNAVADVNANHFHFDLTGCYEHESNRRNRNQGYCLFIINCDIITP